MKRVAIPSVWEKISQATCIQIAQKDARKVASNVDQYVSRNEIAYYALCNTWLHKWAAVDPAAECLLVSEMSKRGLMDVISSLDEDADVICKHVNDQYSPAEGLSPFAERLLCRVEDTRLALELLRYPKRFSPVGADKLLDATISEWMETNRKAREFQLPILNGTLLGYIRDMIAACTPNMRSVREFIPWATSGSYDPALVRDSDIPATAVARTYDPRYAYYMTHHPGSKFEYTINAGANFEGIPSIYSHRAGALLPLLLAEGALGDIGEQLMLYNPIIGDPSELVWCDRIVAVPKNYKKARIVAPQPLICNTVLYRAQEDLREYIAKAELPIYFRDQLPNQEAAKLGSITGEYATLDMTKASDSIPKVVVEYMFPDNWVKSVEPWIPRYSMLPNGQKVRHGMWATSGSVITFPTETIWFWGVCEGIRRYWKLWNPRKKWPLQTIVYGDDILVDVQLAETVIEVLRKFGQTVNVEKSYYSKSYKYRESCGVEYYKGIPLDTHYWPRNTMDFEKDSATAISSLIALQHRFFNEEGVSNFLYYLVRELKPAMTSSLPGAPCTDLWEVGITPITKSRVWGPRALNGAKLEGEETLSELHLSLASSPSGQPDLSHRYDGIGEYLIYQRYLAEGPLYANGLDELLGVSTSRIPRNFSVENRAKWLIQ
jgi:hypothetical protein